MLNYKDLAIYFSIKHLDALNKTSWKDPFFSFIITDHLYMYAHIFDEQVQEYNRICWAMTI